MDTQGEQSGENRGNSEIRNPGCMVSEFSFLFICLVAGHVNPHTETS